MTTLPLANPLAPVQPRQIPVTVHCMTWTELEAVMLAMPLEYWSRAWRAGVSGEDGERVTREGVMKYIQRKYGQMTQL